ncbi:MAG: beta-aspartyl-peptidase [Hahellaceae bacterium]|nr:beta-aspartyl-peptidase [Hahellaceae bacterium]MCP5210992.1 beta-aspartyl-peptidase [Hahellaceae bacterium]
MSLYLVKNGEVFSPAYLGRRDILLGGHKVLAIAEPGSLLLRGLAVTEIDAAEMKVVPGFVDSLVHVTGGGGEGGFTSRTPEMQLSEAIIGGTTTLVGVLGTDSITRTLANLLAKARALDEEGLTCLCHTGSYQVPVKTLTGSIQEDILLVKEFIGVGEVAIADHRSSQPTVQELARIAAEARVGGMLSGKAGIVSVHVGDGSGKLDLLEAVAESTDIPISQFYPTHINRSRALLEAGKDFTRRGGVIDLTTSTTSQILELGEVAASEALAELLAEGVDPMMMTMSSDGNASLPSFNARGELVELKVGRPASLHASFAEAVNKYHADFTSVLTTITSAPAKLLKLPNKGRLHPGADADLVLLEKDGLAVNSVISKGRLMMYDRQVVVKGVFEL